MTSGTLNIEVGEGEWLIWSQIPQSPRVLGLGFKGNLGIDLLQRIIFQDAEDCQHQNYLGCLLKIQTPGSHPRLLNQKYIIKFENHCFRMGKVSLPQKSWCTSAHHCKDFSIQEKERILIGFSLLEIHVHRKPRLIQPCMIH